MKFIYPYKLYFFGLIGFILFSICGFYQIYNIVIINVFLFVLYSMFCGAVILWYYENYSYYKSMYVTISKDVIVIKKEDLLDRIIKSNLEYIIEAKHRQSFRIYNVIHIFTKDGKYFYLTDDINSFEKLRKQLYKNFKDVYVIKNKIISGNFIVSKENLISVN